jgi:DNA-binding transcriptional regulator YhcF (GntR family)
MNENVEVRFSRLERAPAYKTVSDAHSQGHHRRAIADRLPSEEKLAEQFGVNRSTVIIPHSFRRGKSHYAP